MDEQRAWEENYSYLLAVCRKKLKRTHHSPEDMLSQLSVDILIGIRSYDPSRGASLRTYLTRLVINRLNSLMLASGPIGGRRSKDRELNLVATLAVEEPYEDNGYDNDVGEFAEIVRAITESLTEESREIIRLKKSGYTHKQIQDSLKITSKALRGKLDSIKKEVVRVLQQDGIEYERFVGPQETIRSIFDDI